MNNMIYLNGINMVASSMEELHNIARKFSVSKSFFCSQRECYDIICTHKLSLIKKYIKNGERRK